MIPGKVFCFFFNLNQKSLTSLTRMTGESHRLCSFVGKVVVLKLSSVLCYSTDSFFDSLDQATSLTVWEATTTNLLDNFLRDVGTKFAVCSHSCCGTSDLGYFGSGDWKSNSIWLSGNEG